MSMPTRIDDDLFESARVAGLTQSRSTAQQVTYWARLGRELEASTSLSHRAVRAVLDGHRSYDALPEQEQALVRTRWDEGVAARVAGLDLAAEFGAAGESWSEADDAGHVVVRRPPGA